MELRNCIDCGKSYEVFVFPDGIISGSGRCPTCRDRHLKNTILIPEDDGSRIPEFNKTQDARKMFHSVNGRHAGESWDEVQICACGKEYEARWYLSIFGTETDTTGGLCPECQAKREAGEEAKEKAESERITAQKREEWRRSCGIPPTYHEERFTTWVKGRPGNIDAIYTICQEYAEQYPLLIPQGYRSLVLTSPMMWGLGKTHLASSIAHRILDRWHGEETRCPVYMVTESDLMARIRATYNKVFYTGGGAPPNQETEELVLKQVTWVPLLILDDVGKEDVSDPKFVQRMLFRIINGRYNNNKLPMVITTNMSTQEFKRHLGGENGANLSRLLENCRGKFYELSGSDYRERNSG